MSDSSSEPKPLCLRVFQVVPFALAISHIAIGAVYQHDCPVEPYIPIYLIVLGAFSLLVPGLVIAPWFTCGGKYAGGLISLFGFCWFITGNVWIYSVYEPNYSNTNGTETYCNKTLYLYAFWTTNLNYILLALLIISICCSGISKI